MNCKACNHPNSENANFCYYCGTPLNEDTVLTAPVRKTVTAYSIPTSGIRYFQGIGNYALQSTAIDVRNRGKNHQKLKEYATNAKVQPLENGDWYCPDCGEMNNHNTRSCRGCGRYK